MALDLFMWLKGNTADGNENIQWCYVIAGFNRRTLGKYSVLCPCQSSPQIALLFESSGMAKKKKKEI